MKTETLKRLEREAAQPDDIAPVMGCGELRQLLEERRAGLVVAGIIAARSSSDCACTSLELCVHELAMRLVARADE